MINVSNDVCAKVTLSEGKIAKIPPEEFDWGGDSFGVYRISSREKYLITKISRAFLVSSIDEQITTVKTISWVFHRKWFSVFPNVF